MTIKLTEEDVREIFCGLGFLEATLITNTNDDAVHDIGLRHIDHIKEILYEADLE